MQNRYGYFKRVNGVYYSLDLLTQRQTSLKTRVEDEAMRLIAAKNQPADTPQLNRATAKVYASATSPELMERRWQEVMDAYAAKSVESTRPRAARAFRSQPLSRTTITPMPTIDMRISWKLPQCRKTARMSPVVQSRYAMGMSAARNCMAWS